jgi:hypothetical protein
MNWKSREAAGEGGDACGLSLYWYAARNIVSMSKHTTATFREAHPEPPFWRVRFEMLNRRPSRLFSLLAGLFGAPIARGALPAALHAEGLTLLVPPGHPVNGCYRVEGCGFAWAVWSRFFQTEQVDRLLLVAEAHLLPPRYCPCSKRRRWSRWCLLPPPEPFCHLAQRFSPAVELHLITQDGSVGFMPARLRLATTRIHLCWRPSNGRIASALHVIRWFYPKLARIVRQQRLNPPSNFAQVLIQVADALWRWRVRNLVACKPLIMGSAPRLYGWSCLRCVGFCVFRRRLRFLLPGQERLWMFTLPCQWIPCMIELAPNHKFRIAH